MKLFVTIAAITVLLGACQKQPPPADETVVLNPVVMGEKNDLYDVVAPDRIKLAPGVKIRIVDGPGGIGKGMVLMRPNGIDGGYVACSCIGATQGSCAPSSDNPDNNPVCIGGCRDSEGNARACQMEGMIGPPKDPRNIRFRRQQ
jgi:hypothetical protein